MTLDPNNININKCTKECHRDGRMEAGAASQGSASRPSSQYTRWRTWACRHATAYSWRTRWWAAPCATPRTPCSASACVINDLLLWCKNNRLDINWTKTFLMVFTNKRIKIPDSICFKEIEIKCVNEFKLLGITIDSKLSFNTHVSNLGRIINSKLFSIKRLFYLSTSVKVQFFKTFILPYFDYCLTLSIYFNKSVIQRLCNKYYLCLYMLFKLDSHNYTDYNELNEYLLGKFNIPAFQHRIIHRLSIFSYKMLNFTSAPEILKENIVDNFLGSSIIQLSQKEPLFLPDNSKSLRNRVITISSNEKVSKYALKTFTYFSNVFLKCLNLDSFNLKFSSFITYVTSNIKSIFSAFLNRFSNFNFDINKIRLYKSDSVK